MNEPRTLRSDRRDVLDCTAFWQQHDAQVVEAPRVVNPPFFYPVYRWRDHYSFSPLPLIEKKGGLRIDARGAQRLESIGDGVLPPDMFIDPEIERVGGPPVLTRTIRDPESFAAKMAEAMQQDVDDIEALNPGKTNVILCGGKDSLNLLLLKWRNPTLVYSAAPNFTLVRKFVADNGLDLEVRELEDREDPGLLPREIVEAGGMVDLAHWRWGSHLRQIARDLDHSAVFWKGQFADAVMTDYWRSYTSSPSRTLKFLKKVHKRLARPLPPALVAPVDRLTLSDFRRSIWKRGAVLQGAHMGALRSITDCLWVSGYHGPHTARTWLAGDYPRLTRQDRRPGIGQLLLGRDVIYPAENPSPPASAHRQNKRSVQAITEACATLGIPVTR